MKQVFIALLMTSLCITGLVYGSSVRDYQVVDIYVCEEGIVLAELLAKSSVSRKDLYVVSYCTCEGVNNDMKSEVKNMSCEAPKDMVYSCICVGTSSY